MVEEGRLSCIHAEYVFDTFKNNRDYGALLKYNQEVIFYIKTLILNKL